MRRRAGPGTALLTTAVILWPVGAAAGAQAPAVVEEPLEVAARAAQQLSFRGVVLVRWSDGPRQLVERLEVQGADGSVVVRGHTAVMASARRRLVAHESGRWDLLWPAPSDGAPRPPAAGKYELVEGPAATVAGRAGRVVEARLGNRLVERLVLDQETGLLLRREHFEGPEAPDRTIEFESVTIGDPPSAGAVAGGTVEEVRDVVPEPVSLSRWAPAVLPDGYARVGLYRKSGVVQAQYSDGLFDLSVFEQDGRLDGDRLPAGERLPVGTAQGRHYEWAGGHVVIWERTGRVYTAVSDAPLDHILGAVRSLPPVPGAPSFLDRLRQVCRSLLQPFSG